MKILMLCFGIFFSLLAVGLLIGGVVSLVIAYGFRESNLAKTKGYLGQVRHEKNAIRRRNVYSNWVDCEYTYTVGGVSYQIPHGVPGKPENLSRTVTVHYQKKRPKHAFVEKKTLPLDLPLGIFLCISAVLIGILAAVFFLF